MDQHNKCNKYCILVIDFGSQYTRLLLKKIRELGVYSEICNHDITELQLNRLKPNGIILSGGPDSVLQKKTPIFPAFIFKLGIPILGICYGMQVMTKILGGLVENCHAQKEFGNTQIEVCFKNMLIGDINDYVNINNNAILDVWMSHTDVVKTAPKDFNVVGITENKQIAIIVNEKKRLYGVQFHPEVTHTKKGKDILKRFIINICGCVSVWKPVNIIEHIITNIQKLVKKDKVLLAFSGGIDSIVTALLLEYAIKDQFICVFIDNGFLCYDEIDRLHNFCKLHHNLNIKLVSKKKQFLEALIGIKDPEEKRKVIGNIFIESFKIQIKEFKNIKWLAQGTIYSDVIESGCSSFCSAQIIKSHHNVGGLPNSMNIKLLEPIRNLFKDEVRRIGSKLGLSDDMIYRYPSPGPGMAIRILGEVKAEYCDILRKADGIFLEELRMENLYHQVNQAFSIFLPIHSVGIQGDHRIYEWVIALRAIETVDFMTARWARLPYTFLDKVSSRIVNEVSGVSRVVYDISSKPPATIEWE